MRLLSALGPSVSVVAGIRADAHWSEDLAVIRSVGLMQVGGEGVISSALSAGLTTLPVGSLLLRLLFLNPVLIGFGSWLVFELTLRLFGPNQRDWAPPLLSLGAAWSIGLSPSWQQAANTVGSPLVGACLVLMGLWLLCRASSAPDAALPTFAFPALIGLVLCESRWAAAPLGFALLLLGMGHGRLPRLAEALRGVTTCALVVAVGLLPSLLEPLGGADSWRLGLDLDLPASTASLRPLSQDVDVYPLVGALLASGWLFLSERGRGHALPLVVVALGAALCDGPVNRLVLVSICGVLSARGMGALLVWLRSSTLPFKRASVRLAVLFQLSSLLLIAEGGHQRIKRQLVSATREWSEEAFEQLPAHSLLLVHSPQAAWRLWAARLTNGLRPDVVVVPSVLLSHGALAEQLLQLEPKLHRLIRDVAAEGVVTEYALSELADTRPLRVEYDPSWNNRTLEHLSGDGLWFRFAPHALGRSDRAASIEDVKVTGSRLRRAAIRRYGRDPTTLDRVQQDMMQHVVVAAVLGETKVASKLLRHMRKVSPSDTRLKELEATIKEHPEGIPRLDALQARK
jgi:hypothetical protein